MVGGEGHVGSPSSFCCFSEALGAFSRMHTRTPASVLPAMDEIERLGHTCILALFLLDYWCSIYYCWNGCSLPSLLCWQECGHLYRHLLGVICTDLSYYSIMYNSGQQFYNLHLPIHRFPMKYFSSVPFPDDEVPPRQRPLPSLISVLYFKAKAGLLLLFFRTMLRWCEVIMPFLP